MKKKKKAANILLMQTSLRLAEKKDPDVMVESEVVKRGDVEKGSFFIYRGTNHI